MIQSGGGDVMAWAIFSWYTLDPLGQSQHHLNATACLSITADHVCPFMTTVYPNLDGCFQQNKAPCHKSQIISCWFLVELSQFWQKRWSSTFRRFHMKRNITYPTHRLSLVISHSHVWSPLWLKNQAFKYFWDLINFMNRKLWWAKFLTSTCLSITGLLSDNNK